jgi:hypothetical protein
MMQISGLEGLTNVVFPLGLMESYVLAYENTDAYAAQIEAIKKLMDLWKLAQTGLGTQLTLQFSHSNGHHRHDIPVMTVQIQPYAILLSSFNLQLSNDESSCDRDRK